MRLPVSRSVGQQKRGNVRIRRVVLGRRPELEEVEDAERGEEEGRPPEPTVVVGEHNGQDSAEHSSTAQQEGAQGDAGEGAVAARVEGARERVWGSDGEAGGHICSELGVEFGRPFAVLARAVFR